MKLKTVELNGKHYAEITDGKPVYVHDDGKEIPFDAVQTVDTIKRLNGEAKGHRERAETAEGALKVFEGLDAAAARKALDVVKNLDDKKLVDAGEVDRVKSEAIKAVEDKYAPIVKERDKLQASLVSEKVGGSFARSKMIADKLAIPADLVQARFGEHFRLEGENVVAYDKSGNKLFSRSSPGELATFDEALEMIVEQYPYRDSILKGSGASGGGAQNNHPGHAGGNKSMPRAQFDKLDPGAQMAHVKGGGAITD
ncbi:hypothetical protein EO087_00200 [Dyella sp. M7H15-1]|uniref:DUF6651 domain-containing protein n=1 Tax=Dyella sp. M7H15-1 TaxID=2501295 RepID=UPI001004D930|nr:DUF6651 domain-containing protein [Dyella sp. M7H15-1]QAU22586.1 hypothetical protein EO087_00200 [Dyella sp. M7H15-1]